MIASVAAGRLIDQLRAEGITDEPVLQAIAEVPREQFVPPTFRDRAYENVALPIGQGQTISQPYVVALMTQALEVGDRHMVLEVGTGCGYQAAVLAQLARRVFTVERHRGLGEHRRRATESSCASTTSRSASATAARAGPSSRHSTASSSRRLPPVCRMH